MFGKLAKKLGKWAIKTLKREAKESLRDKLDKPFQEVGIPRKKRGR